MVVKATEITVIGPVVISFPCVFQPNKMSGRYEIDMLYAPESDVHKQMVTLEEKAIANRWPKGAPENFISAIKKGDDKQKKSEEYNGMLYSKAKTDTPTQITGPNNEVLTSPQDLKGGNICILSITAFPTDNVDYPATGRSTWLNLYGVRKLAEGTVFGGGVRDSGLDNYEYKPDDVPQSF